MSDIIDIYFDYGEKLATRPEIGHSATVSRFVKVKNAGKADEFRQAVTSSFPESATVLVWEMFTESPDDAGKDSFTTELYGSFLVAQKATSPSDQLKVWGRCRKIALDLLLQMLTDAREGELAEQNIKMLFRQTSGEGVGPLATSWYAYGFEFAWQVPLF